MWWDSYFRNFKLGQEYVLITDGRYNGVKVKFIQVTTKGFNLLNLETSKCLLQRHLYSKEWINKDMPKEFTEIKNVRISNFIKLKEIEGSKV